MVLMVVLFVGLEPLVHSTNGRIGRFPSCHGLGYLDFAEKYVLGLSSGNRKVVYIVWLVYRIGRDSNTMLG